MINRVSISVVLLLAAGVLLASTAALAQEPALRTNNSTGAAGAASTDPRTNPITLNLTNTPVRAAIDALFKFVPFNHVIASDVDGTVSVSLDKVPFEQALRAILRINDPPLTFRREEGIYSITVKQEQKDTGLVAAPAPGASAPDQSQDVQAESRVHKLSLNFSSASDIGALFGAQAPTSRANRFTMGGMMGGGMGGGYGGGMMGGGMGGYGGGGYGGGGYGGGGFGGGGFGGGGFGGGGYGGGGYGGGGYGGGGYGGRIGGF